MIAYSLRKAVGAFVEIDYADFERESAARMRQSPKKVLYINGFGPKDRLYAYPRYYFNRQYGKNPNATFMEVSSFEDMLEKLAALPQDSSFDRIEIAGHGASGTIQIGAEGAAVSSKNLGDLRDAKLRVAAPGAELRFVSCSLGVNSPTGRKGEQFLLDFGKALMPEGGKTFAATRNIVLIKTPAALRMMADGMGMGPLIDLARGLPHVWRDWSEESVDPRLSTGTQTPDRTETATQTQAARRGPPLTPPSASPRA